MKTIETINLEKYFCDECGKSMELPYIQFQIIEDLGMRLIENRKSNKSRHLTFGRKDIDLCSIDCGKIHLGKINEELLYEVIRT